MTIRFERTTELPPGAGQVDWEEIRAALEAHKAAKRGQRVGDDGEVEIASIISVTQSGTPARLEDLPSAAKSVASRLLAKGWSVKLQRSATHHTASRYAADSKKNPDKRAGDIKVEAHDQIHWGVGAVLASEGTLVAKMMAYWDTVPANTKAGMANKFVGAHLFDVVGGRVYESAATPFEDWVAIFAPKPESKTRKKKATEVDMLNGGEWDG